MMQGRPPLQFREGRGGKGKAYKIRDLNQNDARSHLQKIEARRGNMGMGITLPLVLIPSLYPLLLLLFLCPVHHLPHEIIRVSQKYFFF